MRIAVVREVRSHERRVALVPELVKKLADAGHEVVVESGAGASAFHTDESYQVVGASIRSSDAVVEGADVIVSVQPLTAEVVSGLGEGTITMSFLPIADELDTIRAAQRVGVTMFALELVPRISRAQSMDALTSQALVSGYRAVLIAAERLPKFFPLSMTAAGTVPPAQVLVLGAGVAGLQAIATARRLGAQVEAYDVRAAAAEEVRSLGARFVELDLPTLEGSGGYAREMDEERAQRQRDLLAEHVAAADVLITTAAVPGRRAPLLVESAAVERMKPGSVVVDLAAESGGNVEGSRPGEEQSIGDVVVYGSYNVPSQLPVHASRLYAANVASLLLLMSSDDVSAEVDGTGPQGRPALDFDDEIIAATCVVHGGEVRHEPTRELLQQAEG